jgi:predicted TIM-barrel fold metal-dependent hydrolase
MAHVGVPWHREACEVAWKNENVWLDLSGLLLADDEFTNQMLAAESLPDAVPGTIISDLRNALTYLSRYDRLLYGTDLGPISCSMANYRRFIERIIPAEHHQRVFQDNAEELFGVSATEARD